MTEVEENSLPMYFVHGSWCTCIASHVAVTHH